MKKIFKKAVEYIKTHKYALVLLYWILHTVWYEAIRIAYADKDVLFIHSALDDSIPFIEWFAFPYCLWFPYIAAVLIWGLYAGKREFLRNMALIVACMFIPMVFCTLVPNGLEMSMRPDFETLGRDNIGIWLTKFVYSTDSPPRCVMPSMHCAVSLSLFWALIRSEKLKEKRLVWPKICGGLLSLAIILATVFIKQHSILDLIAGLSLSIVTSTLITLAEYMMNKRKAKQAA